MIKHIRLGDVELVRRVYFAVRTDTWDTVYPEFSQIDIDYDTDVWQARWTARCAKDAVDYRWAGTVEAHPDGMIRFVTEGNAVNSFGSNRIGLCLLLSADALAGSAFTATMADGSNRKGVFSEYLDHALVASSFTAIRFQPLGSVPVECTIDGAAFDMEDQRLYMDTTYKAYAPMPHRYPSVEAGEAFGQSFSLRLSQDAEVPEEESFGPVDVAVGPTLENTQIPKLGLTLYDSSAPWPLDDEYITLLQQLELDHVRIEVDARDTGAIQDKLRVAKEIAPGILISVTHLTAESLDGLARCAAAVQLTDFESCWIETCDAEPALLPQIRETIASTGLQAHVGGPGSSCVSGHPAMPEWAAAVPDFLSWSGSPVIHQEDDGTMMENAAGVAAQLESARHLQPGVPLAMGPFQLDGVWPRPAPTSRYRGQIAAAWIASAVKHLAEHGAALATLFSVAGPAGVLQPADQTGADQQTLKTPAYACLQWLAQHRWQVRATQSSDPLGVQALALTLPDTDRSCLLLINQRFQDQLTRVSVEGDDWKSTALPGTVAIGGTDAAGEVSLNHEFTAAGQLEIALPPYSTILLQRG
jgi:hypothetical protein